MRPEWVSTSTRLMAAIAPPLRASAFASRRTSCPNGRGAPRASTPFCPVLYLRGISAGDFQQALAALLGKDAPNLSAAVIARLKSEWEDEYRRWQKRDLSARDYVYVWADGVQELRPAGVLLDRLTHHVYILEMNGDSYRLNQSKRRSRRNNPDTPKDDLTPT
jgi:hypothetical protein